MAKEINKINKKTSSFNIIGKALVTNYTFGLDRESQKSDWVYNQMNLKVRTNDGDIQSEMMGGYGSNRSNFVYVHGTKVNDNGKKVDDFANSFKIEWEDRFDEEILETVGERSFITVGLEKDSKDKTVYKKFVSEYDAIQYIESVLEDGMTVNVKGDLAYSAYNGNLTVRKNIRSIALSNAEEEKHKATFIQTLIVDSNAVGKPNKETRTVPIDAMVVDFAKEVDGKKIIRMVNGKKKEGLSIPLAKAFDFRIGEDVEKAKRMVKYFKAKNKKVTEITVDGIFSKGNGLETVSVTIDDIPDDIKELIELELIDEKEVLDKMAFANGGNQKPEQMIIIKPHLDTVQNGDSKILAISVEADKYNDEDLYIDNVLSIQNAFFDDETNNAEEEMEEVEDDTNAFDDDEWVF